MTQPAKAERTYELLISDHKVGHIDLGFMDRREGEDPDDEDARYRRFLRKGGFEVVRVHDGRATVLA